MWEIKHKSRKYFLVLYLIFFQPVVSVVYCSNHSVIPCRVMLLFTCLCKFAMPADDTGMLKIIFAQTFSLASLLNLQKLVGSSLIGTWLSQNSLISTNKDVTETLHLLAASSGSSSLSGCVNMSLNRSPSRCYCTVG